MRYRVLSYPSPLQSQAEGCTVDSGRVNLPALEPEMCIRDSNNRVIPDLKKSEDLPYKADMQDANGAKIDKKGRADKMAAKAMLSLIHI